MTNMKRLAVTELHSGMVIASTVSSSSNILVIQGSAVTPRIISLLEKHNISHVYIETDEELGDEILSSEEIKVIREKYDSHVKSVTSELEEISGGKTVALGKLYEMTAGIVEQLNIKSAVFSHLNALKLSEEPTYTHSSNVSLLCNVFGEWIGLGTDDLVTLTGAALIHDIGKLKIPRHILNKPDRLSDDEFKVMKSHTVRGYELLKNQDISDSAKLAALMHHEKIDGTGYPFGMTGERINRIARIITICDIYDAMTSDRVYRKAVCPFDVIGMFEQKSYGELDTEYLLVFLKNVAYTYLHRNVILTDGSVGEIVFIDANHLTRPLIRTLSGEMTDLRSRKDISIAALA
jgi:HD-GYP domain-containing protein (c-di-GMP phosphodiesterase class II)